MAKNKNRTFKLFTDSLEEKYLRYWYKQTLKKRRCKTLTILNIIIKLDISILTFEM